MRSMTFALALALAAALGGCSKDDQAGGKAKAQETVGPDGVRRVPIEAGSRGYTPAKVTATPGEKLILVFTRTADGECTRQVKVAGGEVIELPMHQPVEIPVTAPPSGQVKFACGMDMMTGVIAVN